MSSVKFTRAIRELSSLRAGKPTLTKQQWYKLWARWRNFLAETREYRLFRAKVIVREDGICQRCQEDGEHVHHIIHVYKDLDLCVDPRNGELLCAKCHDEEHEGRIFRK